MEPGLVQRLLDSPEPAVRLKVRLGMQSIDPYSLETWLLREGVRASPRVHLLLSERLADGTVPLHPYQKWRGAHWVLVCLAELGYPPGDPSLLPLAEQVLDWLLSDAPIRALQSVDGRVRIHASQEGNALYALLSLGLADERAELLSDRLLRTQWPDGGWNCDRRVAADTSSFMETLIPMRGLALHAALTGDSETRRAARRAAEVFLTRHLYKRRRDGSIINTSFLQLHYPCYWHYDILFGLKVMAEAGLVSDERCGDALDLLESRRLPDGGFPADRKYYRTGSEGTAGTSLVDWGGTGRRMNEFVTAEALTVLRAAGRLPDTQGA